MRIIVIMSIMFFIFGCNNESTLDPARYNNKQKRVEITKVSESRGLDQHITNRAKELLSAREDLTSIKSVNSTDKLIVAFDVKQRDRFRLKNIQKSVKDELDKEFPDVEIKVSYDKKIFLELDELEREIESRSISHKELDKRVEEIIKLANEQT